MFFKRRTKTTIEKAAFLDYICRYRNVVTYFDAPLSLFAGTGY
jgi:hypothetical protein